MNPLSPTRFSILLYLEKHPDSCGFDLVRRGVCPKGSAYTILHRLEQIGLASSSVVEKVAKTGPPRRAYRLTSRGLGVLAIAKKLAEVTEAE